MSSAAQRRQDAPEEFVVTSSQFPRGRGRRQCRRDRMSVLIIATSLNPQSRSQRLARVALEQAKALRIPAELLDLREHSLPLAGSEASWEDATAQALKQRLQAYRRFLFAMPIYNFDGNAAAKNLLELCGGKWLEGGVAGFICTAGGRASYMAPLGLMNSLMLDFRVWIAPRFVYATDADWTSADWQERVPSDELSGCIRNLVLEVTRGIETLA
jgi:NAD(P)H-dependent FMN reductase